MKSSSWDAKAKGHKRVKSNTIGGGSSGGSGPSVSFALEDGPTSTTKALMVSITVPRFVATSKLVENNDDTLVDKGLLQEVVTVASKVDDPTATETNNDSVEDETIDLTKNDPPREDDTTAAAAADDDDIQETDDPSTSQNTEKLVTSGELNDSKDEETIEIDSKDSKPDVDPDLKVNEGVEEQERQTKGSTAESETSASSSSKTPEPTSRELIERAVRETPQTESSTSDPSLAEPKLPVSLLAKLTKSSNSGDEEKVEETEEEITPEEAAHVVVSNDDPDETEVNVEALLRLTLKTLLEEWHLLTIPTYTRTDRQLSIVPSTTDTDASNSGGGWVQVQFMARSTSLAVILDRMDRIGVGTNCGSLSVYKAELCRTTSAYAQAPMEEKEQQSSLLDVPSNQSGGTDDSMYVRKTGDSTTTTSITTTIAEESELDSSQHGSKALMQERAIEAARMEWKNAATRLRIEQVREQIAEQAALNFDFMALLTIASILAGVGLITNNTVVIVASMLVSPIMGPVLGLTFGSRIHDWPLVLRSLANEMLALVGCVLVGALISLGASFTALAREEWPTNEMLIRGESIGLLTGIAIAIPSGMGVCLSILGGNTSSLVGVAISASLLPPAVNAGICFMHSLFLAVGAVETDRSMTAGDFVRIGAISFALTALNIVCIWVSGLFMFEIKEVAPAKQKSAFWAKDIKVARELNKGGNDKPVPVDISVIQEGIHAAIERDNDNIVFGPSPRRPSGSGKRSRWMQRASSGNNVAEAFHLSPPGSLTDLHSSKPHKSNNNNNNDNAPASGIAATGPEVGLSALFGSIWAGWTAVSTGNMANDRNDDEDNNSDNKDVRYVGLEDMGALLGFDQEDEEYYEIDHADLANHIGTGYYI